MEYEEKLITVKSNIRDYEVRFAQTTEFIRGFEDFPHRCYVVDSKVWQLHAKDNLRELERSDVIVFPVDEDRKCLTSVQELYDHMIERSAKRNMTMISIGGGTLQDITGFVASTLYRGILWVFVPTTLLAQGDSCIGGKTSLNYKGFKNLIGTFYPPSRVYIYTPFLVTQGHEHFFSGLGELVKLHILGGERTTQRIIDLVPGIIRREPLTLQIAVKSALHTKLQYIIEDEFDTGRRMLLNFGHCFGHALEAVSQFEIPHGQAVLLGILLANIVSRRRQILSEEMERYISEKLLMPFLVVRPNSKYMNVSSLVAAMKMDKKRTGSGLACILMRDNYEMVKVDDLSLSEVSYAIDELSTAMHDFVPVPDKCAQNAG